jgi:hypothetical protein
MIDFNPLIPTFSRREKEFFQFLEVSYIESLPAHIRAALG